MKIAYICCVCPSEFRIILRQDGTESGDAWNQYGHISNWMGAEIQLARKWHERAREGTSRLLALLCVVDSEVCIFKNCVRKNIYSSSVLGSIVLGRTNIVLGRIVLIQTLC